MRLIRSHLWVLLALVSAAGAGILTSPALSQQPRYAGTQIVALLYSSVEGNAIRKLVESGKFRTLTGIDVEVTMLSWDNTRQKLLLAFSTKDPAYDAVLIDNPWLPDFATRGVIEPLGKYMKDPRIGDPKFNMDDFPKQLTRRVMWNNDFYAFPYTFEPSILMYRKDLFEDPKEKAAFKARYGYDLAPPETLAQLKDAAEFFTRKSAGTELYGLTTALKRGGFAFNRWKQYALALGGTFFDDKGKPKVDTPQNIESLEFLISLKQFMPPTVIEMTGGESGVYFSSGKAAMSIEFAFYAGPSVNPATSKIAGKVGFALVPKGTLHVVGNGGTILSVFSHSKKKEAAYKFIEWLCSVEGERLNVENQITPMRISLAKDPEIQKRLPWLPVQLETNLNIPYAEPLHPQYPPIQDIVGEEVNAAFSGAKPAKQALVDAQARIERMTAK